MNKNLKTVQTIFNVIRVLVIIGIVGTVIGIVGSSVGLLAWLIFGKAVLESGFISDVISEVPGAVLNDGFITAALVCAILSTVAALLELLFVKDYLTLEKSEGTPFTHKGADKLFRLGIVSIVIPVALSIAIGVSISIIGLFTNVGSAELIETEASIGYGLLMMALSVVFRYGADLEGGSEDQSDIS